MGEDTLELFKRALALPEDERGSLASTLLASLRPPSKYKNEDEFKAELARRSADMDSGRVKGVPWDEAREELRKSLESRSGK